MAEYTQQTYDEDMPWPPKDFTGEWVVNWPNGMLKFRSLFLEGKPEGEYLCRWENGELAQIGKSEDGKSVGLWLDYRKDGTKLKENEIFAYGTFQVRHFDKNGRLSKIEDWKDLKRISIRVIK